jgi:gamma-glutamyl-gamma-aminobutyrate hydrolase PuuD
MSALRIGVTASATKEDANIHRVTENMTKALAATGIEMITLDYPLNKEEFDKILPALDGVIMAGGPDVHPKYFGQEIDPITCKPSRCSPWYGPTMLSYVYGARPFADFKAALDPLLR